MGFCIVLAKVNDMHMPFTYEHTQNARKGNLQALNIFHIVYFCNRYAFKYFLLLFVVFGRADQTTGSWNILLPCVNNRHLI